MKTHLTHLTYLTALLLLAPACTVVSYTTPSGEHFTRGSLGANTSISSLSFEAGTNGVRRVDLRGYQNDSAHALGAVTEAAVRAALAGATARRVLRSDLSDQSDSSDSSDSAPNTDYVNTLTRHLTLHTRKHVCPNP